MFLAGSPGVEAHLHMRQLGLFGIICRIPTNLLHAMATLKLITEPEKSTSWFSEVRNLCINYSLPSPIHLLTHPMSKQSPISIKQVTRKILKIWEENYYEDHFYEIAVMLKERFLSSTMLFNLETDKISLKNWCISWNVFAI